MASPNLNEQERHGWVRVGAATPRLTLGDVPANVEATRQLATRASGQGARVVVFPELGLTGYSCGDLFHQSALQQAAIEGLQELIEASADWSCFVVVGLPMDLGGRLYNVAAVICHGQLLGLVPKTVLPNANEFYERRWFSPAETLAVSEIDWQGVPVPVGTDLLFEALDVPGLCLGVEICEDLWSVIPPSSAAATAGATVLANLSASNELLGKAAYRRDLVRQQSARCLAAYVYASAGVGESSTDLVFSGHNLIAENGVMRGESERFALEDQLLLREVDLQWLTQDRQRSSSFRDQTPVGEWRRVELSLGAVRADGLEGPTRVLSCTPFVPPEGADREAACSEIFEIQASGLARRLEAARARAAVIGLSGGLDSTLALLVAVRAAQKLGWSSDRVLGLTMPGFGTSDRTFSNAGALAQGLGIDFREIPIGDAVTQHFKDIGHDPQQHDVVYENAQARERTQILMDVANQVSGIVVGTGDLSEAALGWCTFNGDHMSMYHVNAGVPKTLVRYLIAWCAEERFSGEVRTVLQDIIDTPITPELLPLGEDQDIAQKTEEVVGPYELHDFFLFHLVRHGASPDKLRFLARHAFDGTEHDIERWLPLFLKRFASSQFKRSVMPDGPKVGTVALSPRGDWRMPSDWMGDLSAFLSAPDPD